MLLNYPAFLRAPSCYRHHALSEQDSAEAYRLLVCCQLCEGECHPGYFAAERYGYTAHSDKETASGRKDHSPSLRWPTCSSTTGHHESVTEVPGTLQVVECDHSVQKVVFFLFPPTSTVEMEERRIILTLWKCLTTKWFIPMIRLHPPDPSGEPCLILVWCRMTEALLPLLNSVMGEEGQ